MLVLNLRNLSYDLYQLDSSFHVRINLSKVNVYTSPLIKLACDNWVLSFFFLQQNLNLNNSCNLFANGDSTFEAALP